ncbi:aspartate aminotransferase, partial [Candidatus Pacearchaeota archaeon]|nr:aspartate aminotransferase [Candidatus Pacearchaeota archaeon]
NAPHISQSLVLSAYSSERYEKEKKQKYNLLRKRFKAVAKTLKEHAEYKEKFEALPFNSGYFMCIRLKDNEGEALRNVLLEKYDTGIIAMGKIIRIAFSSCPTEFIPELFENLYKACNES